MKLILGFSIPLLFGNLFQQFYSMVDTMIVGRVLGTGPLAAVGSTGSITFLIIGFCLGLCSGFAIPVAQRFGSRDYKELRRFIGNAVWLCVGFGIVLTVLTVIFCRNILELMGTPADIIDDAYAYLVVIFAGIPATFLYNMLAGIQRAIGDSRTPVVILVIASIINIVLDIVLVVFIPMGVAGAAVATVASQLIGGVVCLLYVSKHYEVLKMTREDFKINVPCIKRLLSMGLPMALQTSITAIGSVFLQASVNSLGSTVVASLTAGSICSSPALMMPWASPCLHTAGRTSVRVKLTVLGRASKPATSSASSIPFWHCSSSCSSANGCFFCLSMPVRLPLSILPIGILCAVVFL